MAHSSKISAPWVVIAVLLFLVWPLGLVLLVKKLTVDRSATFKCGNVLFILSIIIIFIGSAYLTASVYQDSHLAIHACILLAGGLWLFILAISIMAKGRRYKKYIDLVVNKSMTSIEYIAAEVGVPYNKAVDDLRKMVSARYFPGAHVSIPRKELYFSQPQHPQAVWDQRNKETKAERPSDKVVSCTGCGANNKVPAGQLTECEYCGSPLGS